jgi:GTP-binding protein
MKPQVVIVGRPNVGKSSLVNRLAGRRVAVVEEHRGVTRDRKTFEVEWTGSKFDVVDTGGWLQSGDELEETVSQQAVAALDQAALILLVVDAAVGMTDEDQSAARWVLRTGRPVAAESTELVYTVNFVKEKGGKHAPGASTPLLAAAAAF